MTEDPPQIECLVCTSCRRGLAVPEGAERPGSVLRRRLAA
jgi:hypothetical protein